MSEGASDIVSEAELKSRLNKAREKPISQEALDEFSKGDVQITNRAIIKGEDDERKLHIRIKWNDPAIAIKNNHALALAFNLSGMHDDPKSKTGFSDLGLDIMNLDKRMFQGLIFDKYVSKPLQKISDGILKKYNRIKEDGSRKAEKRKKELLLQLGRFNKLREYVRHLHAHNAVVITIEEKPKSKQKPLVPKKQSA